jgi:uncharacterized membrane protein YgdD (TMEM256/DUF423 family)
MAGLSGVALGAFGAHALRDSLAAEMLAVYRTGSLYHLVHAPVLLGIALLLEREPAAPALKFSALCLCLGIVLFSGSLYLLSVTGRSGLGIITPFGGLALLAGWGALAVHAFKKM